MHKSDSNAAAQAKINAEQLNDWKQSLQQDSGAQSDLEAAANDYATDNGYSQDQVDAPLDSTQVNNTAVYPYSYWFGYPTWYPYAYWYPYPYWYDWGFYYGPYGNIVVFGFPSFYFTNWYFCYPHHWNRYPYLGSAYIHHYYGPRQYRLNTLSRQVVHNWVQANRSYLPAGFTKANDVTRTTAMRQYGALNEKVANKDGTINTQARDKYFTANTAKYPALNSHPEQAKVPAENVGVDVRQPFTKEPVVNPQRTQSQRVQRQQYSQPQRAQTRSVPQPRYNYNTIQKAQTYQRGTWEQTQPAYHAAPQYSAPARSAAPAPSAPARSSGGGFGGGGRR